MVLCLVDGSSPHTRGARADSGSLLLGGGIIPAYAGSTRPDGCRRAGAADHPRIRGEHVISTIVRSPTTGSSPHTRGAPFPPRGSSWIWRIIPAYAGSTRLGSSRRRWRGDHPRIRGEHSSRKMTQASRAGSSPHTRGAPDSRTQASQAGGIIPAYAGSTRWRSPPAGTAPDHPRIRGEHLPQTSCIADRQGSSPHTRGAQQALNYYNFGPRIIPAYAGSTTSTTW